MKNSELMNEWLLFNAKWGFPPAILWRKQVRFQWNGDEVRFVLEQHPSLDIYGASSLKQQSANIHVAPFGHFILIQDQSVFALSP